MLTKKNAVFKILIPVLVVALVMQACKKEEEARKVAKCQEIQELVDSLYKESQTILSEGSLHGALSVFELIDTIQYPCSDHPVIFDSVYELRNAINSFQKTVSYDFIKKTLVEMSKEDFELLRSNKLSKEYFPLKSLNALFLRALFINRLYRFELKNKYKTDCVEAFDGNCENRLNSASLQRKELRKTFPQFQ